MKKSILTLTLCFAFVFFANAQKKLTILTIGDSNGTFEYSWPQQLKKALPGSMVVNKSVSGNTIGFDNLDRAELNTLKNINRYMEEAFNEIGPQKSFDYVFVNLGTNDTKRVFVDRQKEVPENMSLLIRSIRQYFHDHQKPNPQICLITPSPMDELKANAEKYGGGDLRIQKNNAKFRKVAAKNKIDFLDTYSLLKDGFSEKTTDGVHLNEKAQLQLSSSIINYLNHK